MMHKIGQRISGLRKERNMSQEELAAILNVSRQTISKWETGDTLPDVYNAVALAKLFHVSLDELVLGTPTSKGQTSYMAELKEKQRKMNLIAILVGAFGTASFAIPMILLSGLGYEERTINIALAIILPVLFFCWGFAMWGFIKVSRIGDEIKYLEKVELASLQQLK